LLSANRKSTSLIRWSRGVGSQGCRGWNPFCAFLGATPPVPPFFGGPPGHPMGDAPANWACVSGTSRRRAGLPYGEDFFFFFGVVATVWVSEDDAVNSRSGGVKVADESEFCPSTRRAGGGFRRLANIERRRRLWGGCRPRYLNILVETPQA